MLPAIAGNADARDLFRREAHVATLLDHPQGRYSIFQYHGAALPLSGSIAERDIVTTLERITGQSLESPVEWWAWWGEQ